MWVGGEQIQGPRVVQGRYKGSRGITFIGFVGFLGFIGLMKQEGYNLNILSACFDVLTAPK